LGATWPQDGQIVLSITWHPLLYLVSRSNQWIGIRTANTPLAGLLLPPQRRHADDDRSSHRPDITVASGGPARGFWHVGPDGRLYITPVRSDRRVLPIVAPHVLAVIPANSAQVAPIVSTATITFDSSMRPTRPASSVTIRETSSFAIPIRPDSFGQRRHLRREHQYCSLWFESLLPEINDLKTSPDRSERLWNSPVRGLRHQFNCLAQ